MTLQQAAQSAIDVQEASNLSGVLSSYHAIVSEVLWSEARRTGEGTNFVNSHPINYLFLYKLLALNGHEPLDQWDVFTENMERCKELAKS